LISPELVIAVTVLEEQHVRRAAERLGVAQPTVSAVMHRLADAIGAPLVAPCGRGIATTAAGRAFLPAAREALVNLSAAGQDLQEVIGLPASSSRRNLRGADSPTRPTSGV
jgi:DNA-binding transcriptional LysR family regulator